MAKLYESRNENLNCPLTKEEVGFVFESDNININSLVQCLDNGKFGAYLVGGIIGTGKSSLVDIAAGFSKTESLLVHVNFYNEEEALENFSTIVCEYLIDSIDKSKNITLDNREEVLKEYKMRLRYSIEERIDIINTANNNKKQVNKQKTSIHVKLGAALRGFFSTLIHVGGCKESEKESEYRENDILKSSITMSKNENNRIKDILSLIRKVEEQNDVNIIFVYDELDKMGDDLLEKFFRRYKQLFVENNIFNFFLVDDKMYIKYSENNIYKNKVFTYLVGNYYTALLTLDETVRYCVMMFGEHDYLACLRLYYRTLGNYRMINICYKEYDDHAVMTTIKSYILLRVIDKMYEPYMEKYYIDAITVKVKIIIEGLINQKNFTLSEFENYLEQNKVIDDVWPKKLDLIGAVVDVIREIQPNAIQIVDDHISINTIALYKACDGDMVRKKILTYRRQISENADIYYVGLKDMYNYMNEGEKISGRISYLRENIKPLKVDINNPETYEEALSDLIESNLYVGKVQVLILKRARGEESLYERDHVYTGIVIVDKDFIQIAYYVDEGSYDSEAFYAKEKLEMVAKKYGVNVKEIKIEKYLDLENEMTEIVKRYNSESF